MTARLFKCGVLGALLAFAGVVVTEILLVAGYRPLSPLGWSGVGVLAGALLGGLPAALAGAAVAASYTALQYGAPHRFAEFFGNPINILAWVIGLGLLAALCVWLRSRLDRLQSAERELRASDDRFRSLVAMSSDWYWELDAELRFTRLSGSGLKAFGLSEGLVVGKRSLEVSGFELISPPADEFERLRARRLPYRDVRGRFALEGQSRYVSIDGDPVFDDRGRFCGYRGVTRDITDRFNADQIMRDSEARFRALFELAPDAIIVHSSGRVRYINDAAVRLFGAGTRDALIGLEVNRLVYSGSSLAAQERLHDLIANPGSSKPFAERKYQRFDGSTVDVEVAGYSYADRGEVCVVVLAHDITDRKNAERSLASAKERLQRAMEGSNLSLWDTDLRAGEVFLSEGWADLLGEPAGETRTTVDALMKQVHPADLAPIVLLSKQTIQGKRDAYATEHRVRTRSGDWKWIRSAGKVSERDAGGRALRMSGTNLDITKRKLAELALRESEERFRSLTSMSSDWYWEQDENFRFTFVTGQFRDKTGIEEHAPLGKKRWDFPVLNVTEQEWAAHRARLERHEPFVDLVMRLPDTDGRAHWVSSSGEPVFDELKRFRGYRGIGRDVTAEHLARERIERLNSELEERVRTRTAELEGLVKELETFHFAVAHDLNTSLGVMSVSAGMLLHDLGSGLAEEHQRALRRISENAVLTARLLDDLLVYSRLGREAISQESVPMDLLAKGAWQRLSHEEVERQLSFKVVDLPACRGDGRMLTQLWTRLLSNAIKFTRTREQARIEAGFDAARGAYFVRDNGVGFDMQHVDRLFGVFERLQHDEPFEGTGVGLAVAARIVRRHGGRIWAEARPGEGATFWFTISGEAAA